jgi:pimeloyl-ACP methyl ester carboxylesterase
MAKDTLILIPGLLNDGELWRDQIDGLGEHLHCQVADITQAGTIEAMAQTVLISAPREFALAGFSLGGYVAQEILRQAPERVTRLALLNTSILADTPERQQMRQAVNKAAILPGKFHGFGEKLLESYLAPDNRQNETIVSRIRGMTARLGPDVFVRQNSVERKDGCDVISGFSKPLLLLCGQHDGLTPVRDHVAITEIAPLALFKLISRAGHMTPMEEPGTVTDALRLWLGVEYPAKELPAT